MDPDEWPMSSRGYELGSPIGFGAFGYVNVARVLRGRHKGERVAIKSIDLEQFPDSNLEEIRKEIQIMRLSYHENVVSYHVCFLVDMNLWLVMPVLEGGSVANVIKTKFPCGIKDESIIATILMKTLEGLSYFHMNNQIHRDIKAGNILVDSDGSVFISDFGVAAKLKEGKSAKTLVGSPCWIAPEVIDSERRHGYDFKADVWSLGITAIELAEGQPPLANYPAMKVIMMVMHKEPPSLGRMEHWSSEFRDFVNSCLQKDPADRPTAEQLLRKKFLRKARDSHYLALHFVNGLPPLEARVSDMPEPHHPQTESSENVVSWDFGSSGDYNSARLNDQSQRDPLAELAEDEGDPFEGIDEAED
jgi:serine/threonine-protein kinase OSR1/STK39